MAPESNLKRELIEAVEAYANACRTSDNYLQRLALKHLSALFNGVDIIAVEAEEEPEKGFKTTKPKTKVA